MKQFKLIYRCTLFIFAILFSYYLACSISLCKTYFSITWTFYMKKSILFFLLYILTAIIPYVIKYFQQKKDKNSLYNESIQKDHTL